MASESPNIDSLMALSNEVAKLRADRDAAIARAETLRSDAETLSHSLEAAEQEAKDMCDAKDNLQQQTIELHQQIVTLEVEKVWMKEKLWKLEQMRERIAGLTEAIQDQVLDLGAFGD